MCFCFSDTERESVMKLISAMKAEHLITSDQYIEVRLLIYGWLC